MAKKITIKIDKMTFKGPKCCVPGCKNPGNFSSALVKDNSTGLKKGQLLDFCERCTKAIRKYKSNEKSLALQRVTPRSCKSCKTKKCGRYGDGDIIPCGLWS